MRVTSTLAAAALIGAAQVAAVKEPYEINLPIFPEAYYPAAERPETAEGAKFGQLSPPVYPSPWASAEAIGWEEAYAQARDFVSQLTLLEKVNITTGTGWRTQECSSNTGSVPRLGLKSICNQNGPNGVTNIDYVTAFPAGGTIAASFDRELMYQRGQAIGAELNAKGGHLLLGPEAGPLGRSPQGGRNWEAFAPDPVLSGVAFAETVKGVQSRNVIACAKHFIANEQEHYRQGSEARGYGFNVSEASSSNLDDRTLHELYLWPFADAIRAGLGSVMCAYNLVNNSYSCQNSKLLNGVLKDELGFQGFVLSDSQAQHGGVANALAGLDANIPGDIGMGTGLSYWGPNLTVAVVNGSVPLWRIDDMAIRVMSAYFKVGLKIDEPGPSYSTWDANTVGPSSFTDPNSPQVVLNKHVDVQKGHGAMARNMSARSTVLLKNKNNALPLKKPKMVAVFGQDAGNNPEGTNSCPHRACPNGNYGNTAQGWGSASVEYMYHVSPESALQEQAVLDGSGFQSITNNYNDEQIRILAGTNSATAIVFVDVQAGEGYSEISIDGNEGDRRNLTLWHSGDELIKNVSSLCNNTIVVIHSSGPVIVSDWYDSENVTAILWAGYPGQESGNAITDVLYGKVNPGAKSPFTWGSSREEYGTDILYMPNNDADAPQIQYREGVFIDYRQFDAAKIEPIYEFGFGLSYTTFNYSNIKVEKLDAAPYVAYSGVSLPAPVLANVSKNWADYQYPANWRHIKAFIYPWLNSTDPKTAVNSSDYGLPNADYTDPNAYNRSAQTVHPAGGAPGGNPLLYEVVYQVSVDITNTGNLDGDEVPQLYISLPGDDNPPVVLRNFDRLAIAKGATRTWTADVQRRDISNWDAVTQNWVVRDGVKTVHVGSSSRKLTLSKQLE